MQNPDIEAVARDMKLLEAEMADEAFEATREKLMRRMFGEQS